MRTVFLVLGTVALLVGGFVVYWAMQPDNVARPQSLDAAATRTAEPMSQGESTYTVRGGKNVWLKEFDANRRLTNQFRAEEFVPQKEGFVHVTKPEAHFFMRNGQWIRVTGVTGDVIVSGMPEQGSDPFNSAGGAAPSRGHLNDVHLQLFETLDAATPTLDMQMANAAFDNESFRIFTEGYTDKAGTMVAADQVKVTVRGKYEFDGRGLTIRWNDRDRRLELLEVAHGERLLVKDPGAIGAQTPGKPKKSPKPAARLMPADPLTALASADPKAGAAAALAATRPSDPERESTLYSICFYNNVRVEQSGKTVATGDEIEVFYPVRDAPTAKPATAPVTAPAPTSAPSAAEGAKPQAAVDAPKPSAQSPATKPAPEAQEPVVIYWTGKLRIMPSEKESPVPVEPGQSAVQMRGTPVVLTRDNVLIHCPAFTYNTGDGRVMLQTSEKYPQVDIKQYAATDLERKGTPAVTLLSERVEYLPEQGIATLGGKSRAVFPADQNGASGEMAEASWTREGVARFTGSGDESIISSLKLRGDVDVRHPQLTLKSQQLDLAFDPPAPAAASAKTAAKGAKAQAAGQPTVREVVADGDVHCVLLDEDGAGRELHGQHLVIATTKDDHGNLYAKKVTANGDVRARQAGSELTSQQLAIELAPATRVEPRQAAAKAIAQPGTTTQPAKSPTMAVELKRLTASTNVRAVSEKGDVATGQKLVVVNGADGKPQVELTGKPARVANAAGTVLTSEQIIIPNGDEARAIGPGTLHAVVEDKDPKAPTRHMDVSWVESALMNGKLPEHQVQVVGKVRASMPDADGTVNTANADRILVTLADAPPDPTTKPAAPKPAAKAKGDAKKPKDGMLASTEVDVMKGKQVSRILLNKDAVVISRLTAEDGTVLRETRIDSSLLEYDVPARRLTVPRPGTMLVRDHRPAAEKVAGTAQAPEDQDGLDSTRGATAFRWADALDYSGAEHVAKLTGDVVVAYKPDDAKEPPVRLRAKEVVAIFEDAPKDAPKPGAAAPAAGTSKDAADVNMPKVQLRSVRAEGDVIVNRAGDELLAPRLTFDPITHWMRAVGTPENPAVYTQAGRAGTTTAREFHWNTQTWKIRVIDAAGRTAAGR